MRFSRTVNTLLVTMLSSTLLFEPMAHASLSGADNFWDSLDVGQLHDSTHGIKQMVGPNGERVTSIGGSLTLKRRSEAFPQWFSVQGPSIQASCSGISFRGMFGTIVDLDEIQRQIEEAGASFAYGVLVAIIYSLPGIGDLFQKLDAWAKKIQQMLQNSCNAGKQVGAMIANETKSAAQEITKDSWSAKTFATVGGWANDADEAVSTALDCSAAMYENIGSEVNCEGNKDKVKNALGLDMVLLPSVTTAILLSQFEENHVIAGKTIASGDKEFSVDWSNPGSDADFLKDIAFAALIVSAMGDNMMDEDSARKIFKALSTMEKPDGDQPDGANQKEKKKDIKEALGLKSKNTTRSIKNSGEGSLKLSQVTNFLVNGAEVSLVADENGTSSSDKYGDEILKGLVLPNVLGYAQTQTGGKEPRVTLMAYDVISSPGNNDLKISTSITDYITNYKGIASTADDIANRYLEGNVSNTSSLSFSMFDTDLMRYFAKIYRNTPRSERTNLRYKYILFVKKEIAHAMLDKISYISSNVFKNYDPAPTITATTANSTTDISALNSNYQTDLTNMIKSLAEFRKALEEQMMLEGIISDGSDDTRTELIDIFKAQDRENLKRAYGTN